MATTQAAHDTLAALPTREALGAPGASGAPRTKLRNALLLLFALSVPIMGLRDPQYLLFAPLPLPLLLLTPRGASRVLLGFAAVLVVIGGGVTTYRAGMAVPDYPTTFDQNMWTYPLKEMVEQGQGVTLEHVHRLWASALGLVAICVLLTCFIHRVSTALTLVAGATLTAIILQGLLGGTRVLENSQNLAFLHGALAQAVVAFIAVLTVMASRTWARTTATPSAFARGAHALGPWVAGLVYAQIALGAWLRHQGDVIALLVHASLALAVVVMVLVLAKQLSVAAQEGQERGIDRRPLTRVSRLLIGSLVAQFSLGVLATVAIYFISGGMQAEVSVGEAIFATAHVFVGAVLFCSTVVGALYARRALVLESSGEGA